MVGGLACWWEMVNGSYDLAWRRAVMISDGVVNRCPKTKEVYRLWFIFKMPVEVGGGNKDDTDTILKTWLSTPITTAHQALKNNIYW